MNSVAKRIVLWLVIVAGLVVFYQILYRNAGDKEQPLSYTDLIAKANAKEVKHAAIEDTRITGNLTNDIKFKTELANQFLQRERRGIEKERRLGVIQDRFIECVADQPAQLCATAGFPRIVDSHDPVDTACLWTGVRPDTSRSDLILRRSLTATTTGSAARRRLPGDALRSRSKC